MSAIQGLIGGNNQVFSFRNLLHFDAANGSTVFTDVSGRSWTRVGTSAQISTAQSQFGGSSLWLQGNDAIETPYNAFDDFSAGNFTLEGWFRASSIGTANTLVSQWESVGWMIQLSGGAICFAWAPFSTSVNMINGPTIALNTWYHVAVVKNGTNFVLYLDGVNVGSATNSGVPSMTTTPRAIGHHRFLSGNPPQFFWDGYLDEWRLSPSAIYTANFTRPAAPFPDT